MFELKPIARHLLLACGGLTGVLLLAGPASAQQAQSQEQKLERITITGSNIRRTDTETVAPVEIITREEIERSGKPTIADVLKTLPAATGGSFNESFSNSFAPGASGISLRGLGQKATLVLLNGRRVAGYGFAQNLQDTFVDLNSIPSSAIERIEILKDGASAIYGSDALAGVVNVILRRDYKGIEASAGYGNSEGASDYRAALIGGFGDLASNRYNVFGVLDFYKRDQLLLSDTKFGKSADYRGEQGGRNFTALSSGGTWTGVPGVGGTASTPAQMQRRAISECSSLGGTVLDYAGAVRAGLITNNLATNGATAIQSEATLLGTPLGTGLNQPGNTWCSVDLNKYLAALPETQRIGFVSKGVFELNATTQLFAEVGFSRIETEQTFTPPFFNTTGLEPTPLGLRPFAYTLTFQPGVAGNPFATPARYAGSLFALGTRDAKITSDSMRGLLGAKYSFAGIDFESAFGYSKNEVEQQNFKRLSKSAVNAVFGGVNPTPAAPIGNVTSSTCNLDQPSTTGACSNMLINFPRKAESEVQFFDTKASAEVGSLPGGPIGMAVGFDVRREEIRDIPSQVALSGDILGQGTTATDGSRRNFAVFTEFSLPITKTIEAQAALRNDNYSDFGNALTPKLGLKFRPSEDLVLRANWGRGFRAPSLPENSPSSATFFTAVTDPLINAATNISGVFAGNPNLDPETSRSTTLGFVFEPSDRLNFSVDWYEIVWKNIVGSVSFGAIVAGDVNVFGRQNDATCSGGDPRVLRDPANGCRIVSVFSNYQNLSMYKTRGTDFDVRWRERTAIGRITTRVSASYVDEFEESFFPCAGGNGCSFTYPRWKGALTLDLDRGPWSVTGRVNYLDSYYQLGLGGSYFNQNLPITNPSFQTGTYPDKVPSYTTIDLFARYQVTPKLTVSAAILNVTDETPPYDPWGNGLGGTYLYDPSQYDVRGIQYRVGVNFRF